MGGKLDFLLKNLLNMNSEMGIEGLIFSIKNIKLIEKQIESTVV